MTDDLRKSIDTLRGVTSRMEAATAEAEHVVQMVEKFLNEECQMGVAVWSGAEHRAAAGVAARVAGAEAGGPKSLGYAKVGGRFRIAIRESAAGAPASSAGSGAEHVYAWADAPRGEKLQCFGQLPSLLNHMASLVQDYLESAGQTSVAVAGTLEVMGRGTSKTVSVTPGSGRGTSAGPAITAPVTAFATVAAAAPATRSAPSPTTVAPEPAKKAPLITRVPAKPRKEKASAPAAAPAAAAASTGAVPEVAPKASVPEPPMKREYPAHHTGRPLRLF